MLVTVKLVNTAESAESSEENQPLVVVLLVSVAFVEARVVIVAEAEVSEEIVPVVVLRSEIDPEAEVRSLIVPLVIVVVAKIEVPVA